MAPSCLFGQHFNVVGTTIAETQKAIQDGRTTCRAVVETYLARIRAYDPQLNSIVVINPDALAEADRCDRDFASTQTAAAGGHRRSHQR